MFPRWPTEEEDRASIAAAAKAEKERRRREFLERCAVAFCGYRRVGGFLANGGPLELEPRMAASILVGEWSALWDAIEADERKRRENG